MSSMQLHKKENTCGPQEIDLFYVFFRQPEYHHLLMSLDCWGFFNIFFRQPVNHHLLTSLGCRVAGGSTDRLTRQGVWSLATVIIHFTGVLDVRYPSLNNHVVCCCCNASLLKPNLNDPTFLEQWHRTPLLLWLTMGNVWVDLPTFMLISASFKSTKSKSRNQFTCIFDFGWLPDAAAIKVVWNIR